MTPPVLFPGIASMQWTTPQGFLTPVAAQFIVLLYQKVGAATTSSFTDLQNTIETLPHPVLEAQPQDDLGPSLSGVFAAIDQLRARLEALEAAPLLSSPPDWGALTSRLDALEAAAISAFSPELDVIRSRVDSLELRESP